MILKRMSGKTIIDMIGHENITDNIGIVLIEDKIRQTSLE